MRYAAGYDKDLAEQFFRRTFRDLSGGLITRGRRQEFDYLSARLAETVVFGMTDRIGSPWYRGDPAELVLLTKKTADRLLLQRAEMAANQLLIIESFIARAIRSEEGVERMGIARTLYRHAARARHLTFDEEVALRGLSEHADFWAYILAQIPGNDYLEMLGRRASSTIVLS